MRFAFVALLLLGLAVAGCVTPASPPAAPGSAEARSAGPAAPLTLQERLADPLAPKAASPPVPGSTAVGDFLLTDSGATGPELNLGVTPNGHVFVGGWDHIARSTDGGRTWGARNLGDLPSQLPLNTGIAADRVLITDHQTGRVFVDDTTLGCTILAYSDDEGTSWTHSYTACGLGATDHEKIAVGKRITFPDPTGLLYPNLVYSCANGLSHDNCGVSLDGGLTFLSTSPHGIGNAFQGAPVTDDNGILYEPSTAGGPKVHKSVDNGVHWLDLRLPFTSSSDTPDVATTHDGAVYFFATDAAWKPVLFRSNDGGVTWAGPFAVPVPGLASSVFPVIVGGDQGRVALAFYGTTDNPSGWDHNPGNAPDSVRWNAYLAIVTDADSAAPTIAPQQLTTNADPLQYGCLSKLGGCLNNIADYMDIDASPADGSVYAVYVDGCLPGCANHGQSTADHGVVAAQVAGAKLKA